MISSVIVSVIQECPVEAITSAKSNDIETAATIIFEFVGRKITLRGMRLTLPIFL